MKLAAVAGVVLLLIGFFVYLMTRLSTGDMALLYSDLDPRDSGNIVNELDTMEVPYTLRDGGSTLLVPEAQVDRLRLAMAREGLPSGGSVGYEVFDEGDGFGTTTFQQTMNRQRALEGELARTIGAMANVRQARVRLVLPERELFSRDRAEPSASVFLSLDRGGLAPDQVAAVQHLVAASVLRLQPSGVAVIDDRGNVLAAGPGTDEEAALLTSAEQLRAARERQLREQIEALLARSVGVGHVRAEVAIEMDYDRVVTNSEIYDPESQVAISSQFVEEESSSNEGDGLDPVTVAGNLPEAEDAPALGEPTASSQTNRTEETTNFVVSRTVEDRIREGGVIRRLISAMDPVNLQIVAIAAPTEEEKAHHYLWRFWRHLPRAGRVLIFDRSWYGRVLVERIEGFASEPEWRRAYSEINAFEEQLSEHGILLMKFWLHIDPDEQMRRFQARLETPYKKFKMTEEDYRNREKWRDYELALHEMVQRTSTEYAPWHLVSANNKPWARVEVLKLHCRQLKRRLG